MTPTGPARSARPGTCCWCIDGIASADVVGALRRHIQTLPAQLARSVTWDQGMAMAQHAGLTSDTGIQIYFCDPKSP
jgi:IS30 family transposase